MEKFKGIIMKFFIVFGFMFVFIFDVGAMKHKENLLTAVLDYFYEGKFSSEYEKEIKNKNNEIKNKNTSKTIKLSLDDIAKRVINFKNETNTKYLLNFYAVMKKVFENSDLKKYSIILSNIIIYNAVMRQEYPKLNGSLSILMKEDDFKRLKRVVKETNFKDITISEKDFNDARKYLNDCIKESVDMNLECAYGALKALDKSREYGLKNFLEFYKKFEERTKKYIREKGFDEDFDSFYMKLFDVKDLLRLTRLQLKGVFNYLKIQLENVLKPYYDESLRKINKVKYEDVKDLNKKLEVKKCLGCYDMDGGKKDVREVVKEMDTLLQKNIANSKEFVNNKQLIVNNKQLVANKPN